MSKVDLSEKLGKSWYILYHGCRPSRLIPALRALYGAQNIWWPNKRFLDKFKRPIDKSIFEGYVFIAGNPELEHDLSDIKARAMKAVYGFLPLNMDGRSEDPFQLTESEIMRICELEEMPVPEVIPSVYPVQVGDYVRIKDRSIDRCLGTVESLEMDYATVSMVFFRRRLRIPVPYDMLDVVERAGG